MASLHLVTFYNPARLCRQYGQKQLIPQIVPEFETGPLTQNFLDNLVSTWPRRTIQRGIDYNGDPSSDDQYKAWICLQQTEKDEYVRFIQIRKLQTMSAQSMQHKRSKRN